MNSKKMMQFVAKFQSRDEERLDAALLDIKKLL